MLYSVDILSRVIMEDAYREADAIIEKAKKESAEIIKNGRKEAEDLKAKTEKQLSQVMLMSNKRKIISLAEFRTRNEVVSRKEKAIESILFQIQKTFFCLPQRGDYLLILKKLVIDAVHHLKEEGNKLVCQVNLHDRFLLSADRMIELSTITCKQLSLDQRPMEAAGGVIVSEGDGRVFYDNSLEAIFERQREYMRCLASECIFGT